VPTTYSTTCYTLPIKESISKPAQSSERKIHALHAVQYQNAKYRKGIKGPCQVADASRNIKKGKYFGRMSEYMQRWEI
jgi:hypothetical protein